MTSVTERVSAFYDELPFNYQDTARATGFIRARNQIADAYPDLDRRLRPARTVLDVGCGAGWFSNTCAYYYNLPTRGIDLSTNALGRAEEISSALEVAELTDFRHFNLFELDGSEQFDVVASIGVLHHTADVPGAIAAASRCVAPGGALYLGLYHAPSRRPFLQVFEHYRQLEHERGLAADEFEEAFARYRELDTRSVDPEFLRSWFRDQVLHPHETQHTLAELSGLLGEIGFEVESTSINRFATVEHVEDLFAQEGAWEEHARRRLADGVYLPGFFTVLARRA